MPVSIYTHTCILCFPHALLHDYLTEFMGFFFFFFIHSKRRKQHKEQAVIRQVGHSHGFPCDQAATK